MIADSFYENENGGHLYQRCNFNVTDEPNLLDKEKYLNNFRVFQMLNGCNRQRTLLDVNDDI